MQATSLIFDNAFLNHLTNGMPESPQRYSAILSTLQEDNKLWNSLKKTPPRLAIKKEILRCHSENLFHQVKKISEDGGGFLDEDTFASPATFELACLAAGAALVAIDEVCGRNSKNAFSLARPPGHHATIDKAMGFCFFNNAAIAARYAQDTYHLKKILIIDWDVHHGNGTQDIFYEDPSVFYFSMHEFPFYPGTGSAKETGVGAGLGTTLNVPLPAFTPSKIQRELFTDSLNQIHNIFTPDLIIISAGFDARKGDPLGELQLSEIDFIEMTKEVMILANACCAGKIISILEGGYLNETLGSTVKQHIKTLAGY